MTKQAGSCPNANLEHGLFIVLNPGDKGTIGESADVVIAAIKRDGYYLWPQPKDENVLASKDVLNTTFDLDAEKPKT